MIADLRQRVQRLGFGLCETHDPDETGRRFLIFESGHGLIVHGHDRPLTAEDVEAFVLDQERHMLTADP